MSTTSGNLLIQKQQKSCSWYKSIWPGCSIAVKNRKEFAVLFIIHILVFSFYTGLLVCVNGYSPCIYTNYISIYIYTYMCI